MTHRAAIFSDAVCEAAVAFCSDLNLIGALQQQSLLKVACGLVHVGNAVLAVICNVLGGLSGHKAQEGKLDVNILRVGALAAILELKGKENKFRKCYMLLGIILFKIMHTIREPSPGSHQS